MTTTIRDRASRALLASLALFLGLAVACGPKHSTDPGPNPPGGDGDQSPDQPDASPAEILAASKLPDTITEPIAGDPLAATIHRLTNGMTVYISTDRTKPRISAWIAIRAGSRQDPADSTGLAHYLEHMLFKGSSRLGTVDIDAERAHLARIAKLYDDLRAAGDEGRAEILAQIDAETQKSATYAIPNELDQLYAALGIRGVNAFTSNDETVYVVDVPSNRFEPWARVEGDRFTDPQFRLFFPELEAVYEEKNRSLDSPSSRIFQALDKAMFPSHPYGTQPTIGLVDHLKTPAYGDMVAYFDRWYVPNNMAIILAGDIDAERALPVLEKVFAGLRPKSLPETLPGSIEPLRGRKLVEVVAPGENAVYLGWQTVPANHPDQPVYEVLDLLLDNSTSGLINVDLVLPQKLPRAGSFQISMAEAGQHVVYGTARAGQKHDDVERLLLGVIAKLKRGEVTQADIDAVVVNAEIALKFSLESNNARVQRMANAYINRLPWRDQVARIERMRKVTPADIQRAAARLDQNYIVVRRVAGEFAPPKIDKPKITAVKLDTSKKSAFAKSIADMPVKPLEPQWLVAGEHYKSLEGPAGEIIAVANETSDLFAISYQWTVGSRRQRMLCFALDALDTAGAKKYDAVGFKKALYAMGTSIDASCGTDEVSIQVTGIDRNLERSVELLRDWLAVPQLERATVDKLIDNTVSQRADRLAEPSFVARALSQMAALGQSSPMLLDPSNRQLEALKSNSGQLAIAKEADALLGLKHRTSYFGPRAADANLVKLITLGDRHRAAPAIPALRYRKVRGSTVYFVDKTAAQAQVSLTFPHPPLPQAKVPLSLLYSNYIGGGMGALIFQEIREARGLAYSAWGGYSTGDRLADESALYAGVGTQADKTGDALEAMLSLLENLGQLEPQRFSVAQQTLIGRYRATRPEPRQIANRVFAWRDLSITTDPRPGYLAAIEKAKRAELAAFAKPLAKVPAIIAVTGDSKRIDLARLRKLGRVIEVKPKDLVSW